MQQETEKRNICPQCQQQMVYSPDGSRLVCERCQTTLPVSRRRRTPSEIGQDQLFTPFAGESAAKFRGSARGLLVQGIASVKSGDLDEAYFYLEWVLRTDCSEREQAEAWLWLSDVYEERDEQRECLAYSLAIDSTNGIARRKMAVLDGRLDPNEIVNPENLAPDDPNDSREARVAQFQCPQCSGRMQFAPDGQQLTCDFCGYRQPLPDEQTGDGYTPEYGIGGMEKDFVAALATAQGHLQPVAMRIFNCNSCGVEFTLGPETLSLTCPYCDAVYVTETAETREILPAQAVIPFSASIEEMTENLVGQLKEQRIVPEKLFPLVGVYLPLWTFDISGELGWHGEERKGDRWVPISGTHILLHDDVKVLGRRHSMASVTHGVASFQLDALVPYDPRFLADWPAERYQISLSDASLLARQQLLKGMRRSPASLTGGRAVRQLKFRSQGMVIDSFKLVLVPVWMAHYRLDGRTERLAVNGQTNQIMAAEGQSWLGRLFDWFGGGK